MKPTKLFIFLVAIAVSAACDRTPNQVNPGGYTGANKTVSNTETNSSGQHNNERNSAEHSSAQNLSEVPRPQKIVEMTAQRGEQDQAAPTLKFVEPIDGATVSSSTVKVKLQLGGDLKGYQPMKDMATGMGNHIHVILDNQPYEAHYKLAEGFELRNVADGEHTLRVFPSRPWHESYKNPGAFQMIRFTVKNGGGDASKPTTSNANETMSNASAASEGKDMQPSTAGAVDKTKPLLTYSRPKGEYKGADAENIMIDFWLSNAGLQRGNDYAVPTKAYRVRYSVDGGEAKFIDIWNPIWLSGWANGKHTIKLELVDGNGNLVDNGGYNSTTREITVTR